MALSKNFPLEELDTGISALVININRIPGIETHTNCEGHVWRDCLVWPTKNGWMHFSKPKFQHDRLIEAIDEYCKSHAGFNLRHFELNTTSEDSYTITGAFESHQGDNGLKPFSEMSRIEQRAYWSRADTRKIELLTGWKELNRVVVRYIKENICEDLSKLSYRDLTEDTEFGEGYGMCR